jgi:protein-histidine pros-kinase
MFGRKTSPDEVLNKLDDVTRVLESRESWGDLLEALPDATVIADREGRIILFNHNAELLTAYHRDEIVGQRVESLMPDRFRENHIQHRDRFADEPRPRAMGQGMSLFLLRKDTKEIAVEISLGPLVIPEGTFVVISIRRKRD